MFLCVFFFFFQAEDGIRDGRVTGVQTCALPICRTGEGNAEAEDAAVAGDQPVALRVGGRCPAAREQRAAQRLIGVGSRSEERRVGKECRSRWSADHEKKKSNRKKVR